MSFIRLVLQNGGTLILDVDSLFSLGVWNNCSCNVLDVYPGLANSNLCTDEYFLECEIKNDVESFVQPYPIHVSCIQPKQTEVNRNPRKCNILISQKAAYHSLLFWFLPVDQSRLFLSFNFCYATTVLNNGKKGGTWLWHLNGSFQQSLG